MHPNKKLIYVAGPFRGTSSWAIEQNIRKAEEASLAIWRMGGVAICPHANTRFFQGELPDRVFLDGDLEILKRCDAIFMLPAWQESEGAKAEREFAFLHNVKVLYSLASVSEYLNPSHL